MSVTSLAEFGIRNPQEHLVKLIPTKGLVRVVPVLNDLIVRTDKKPIDSRMIDGFLVDNVAWLAEMVRKIQQ